MTVETRLRSAMAEAVAPTVPDTEQLVSVARRQGLGIRRRRQVLGSAGIAAALAAAVLTPTLVAGNEAGDPTRGSVLVGTSPPTIDTSRTSPISSRATIAALLYAVGLDARGRSADFHGQSSGDEDTIVMTHGRFSFTPTGTSGAGEVGVNVQIVPPETQAEGDKPIVCDDHMEQCKVTQLLDGSVLRTSVRHSDYGERTGVMRIADLNRADGVRVAAYASNGTDITERDERITRDEPVLTTAQLIAVVRQPWWGPRLPDYFTENGAGLAPQP